MYYTALRMEHALKLMEEQGIRAKDIFMEVCYEDESSFRRALNRYLKQRG
ncbi:hypothetical protein [Sphingobacterium sp. UBA6320]|jgi:AraC-like DNA-binding protein|nr:hypothetical protein [Sphingobacterium sp. UBA6320]